MKEMSANLLLYPQCSSLVRPSVETTKEEFISTPLTPRHHSTRGQIARLSLRNTEDYMLMTATTTTVTLTMDDSAAGGNTYESSHLKKKRKEGLNPAKVLVVGKLHYGRRPESQDAVRLLYCQLTTEPRRCQTFVLSANYRAKTLSDFVLSANYRAKTLSDFSIIS
ncbi:serine/threonine-protein kinase MARK1 X6 [Biomphalaria glabrata]|nr:serine/threonine-protein kinase MARK1 X6 [Biomphalaria glabrata]